VSNKLLLFWQFILPFYTPFYHQLQNEMNMAIRKLLPVIFLVCLSAIVWAQPSKNQPTAVILKTANTLLQAQHFDAAEEYFNKALQNAKAAKNTYYQAQAWEGLANLYSKTKQQTEAVVAYQNCIKLYRALGYSVIADLLNSQMKNVLGLGDLHAGIEIGAKGIKLSVIEVKLASAENDYTLRLDTAINTDAAALSYQSEKETYDAISILYGIIEQRFDIPAQRIHIVISSGLKQELDKYNKVEYFAGIVRPKELDPKIKIGYVTVEQEAQMSFRGIVPQMNRLTANQLDVGSGNTKGGYLNANRSFVPITFPVGTKSFQRLLESKINANLSLYDYRKAAEKMIIDSFGRMVVYQFRDKSEIKTREVVYLSGGIVWCIASLMHPELIKQNHVELSLQDITDFQNLVTTDFETLTKPDLNKLNREDAAASMENINKVINTYDQKALLVGSIWLEELVSQLDRANPGKKLIFPRYAYVGWISGYIMDKISKQYTDMATK
jgi:tetratricopeptide (TPR) repeat protein